MMRRILAGVLVVLGMLAFFWLAGAPLIDAARLVAGLALLFVVAIAFLYLTGRKLP